MSVLENPYDQLMTCQHVSTMNKEYVYIFLFQFIFYYSFINYLELIYFIFIYSVFRVVMQHNSICFLETLCKHCILNYPLWSLSKVP